MYVNSGDADQTCASAVSDQRLHCLPVCHTKSTLGLYS